MTLSAGISNHPLNGTSLTDVLKNVLLHCESKFSGFCREMRWNKIGALVSVVGFRIAKMLRLLVKSTSGYSYTVLSAFYIFIDKAFQFFHCLWL